MARHLLSKFTQFREREEFIDVRLKVGEDVFPAHRNVLAANSDYFYAMFTDGMRESKQELIELKDENISGEGLRIVLDSIYSGELTENENVLEILATANHLQCTSVVQQCCNLLDKKLLQPGKLDVQTYIRLRAFANVHSLLTLQEATQGKMASVYKEICETEDFLSLIDAEQLLSLLRRDDLSAPSESFVFKSVLRWIEYKKEERMAVASKVVGAVRLGLVDIKEVIQELTTEEMQTVPEIQALVSQALLHNQMPSHSTTFAVEKSKPRSTKPVLVAVFPRKEASSASLEKGCDVFAAMAFFDFEAKSWNPLQFPPRFKLSDRDEFLCAEYAGNYLYTAARKCDGNYFSGVIYRYHVVNNVWETLPGFRGSNYQDHQVNCLCFVNDYIYAISDSRLPQRYSLAQNKWQSGSELPFLNKNSGRLSHVAAVAMKSKIYVLHGCCTEEGEKSAVFHVFDTQNNEWTQKASPCSPHFGSCLFVDNNKLYVAGGNISVHSNYDGKFYPNGGPAPVEVYNEETNNWSVVPQLHIPSNDLGAVEVAGKVYFIIDKFPFDSGIRIPPGEVYNISLHEWANCKLSQPSGSFSFKRAVFSFLPVPKDCLKSEPSSKQECTARKNDKP